MLNIFGNTNAPATKFRSPFRQKTPLKIWKLITKNAYLRRLALKNSRFLNLILAFFPISSLYVGGIGAWCATAPRLVMGVHRLSPHSRFAPMWGYRRWNRSAVNIEAHSWLLWFCMRNIPSQMPHRNHNNPINLCETITFLHLPTVAHNRVSG